jgi:F-type H+-transporting ATPase subunit a
MIALLHRCSTSAATTARILALIVAAFSFLALPLRANEEKHDAAAPAAHGAAHAAGAEEHHGLTPDAPKLSGFINSSMLVTWIVAAGIIILAQRATRKIRANAEAVYEAPTGAQNFWEFLVEGLSNFLEEIIGRDLAKKTFWFFATVFIFILFTNWFGLLPGVGTVGFGPDMNGDGIPDFIATPLFRGGNADLNMTFAISSIFFVMWVVWALQFNGPVGFVKHLFAPKGESQGAMKVMLIVVFLAVGVLEVISIAFRPVSLSFRLFGNIFAGENLLESMQQVVPALGWLIPLPFYFMELLVGLVQALVFMLLTAVFTLLICSHDEEHHEEGHAHH